MTEWMGSWVRPGQTLCPTCLSPLLPWSLYTLPRYGIACSYFTTSSPYGAPITWCGTEAPFGPIRYPLCFAHSCTFSDLTFSSRLFNAFISAGVA